jgi:RNA polymerase sigma factor (TIGR02999 family)
MSDVTQILSLIDSGDPTAAERILPLVYDELRKLAAIKLAHEKPGQTLEATALVHEAYLRLVGCSGTAQSWSNRGHFFAAAAEAMRRILIDRARDKRRAKRGGERCKLNIESICIALNTPAEELLELDEALYESGAGRA